MLSQKTNQNKNLILSIILIIIVIIIAFFILKTFIFKFSFSNKNEEMKTTAFSRPENFKPLDTSVFDNPKFKTLKNNNAKKIKIEDLEVGRENPFIEPN